jgi:hypothetical protein
MYRQQGIDHKNTTGTIWLVGGLILTSIFWGASGVAVKVAQLQLDTWEVIALRFFVATPGAKRDKRRYLRIESRSFPPLFIFIGTKINVWNRVYHEC